MGEITHISCIGAGLIGQGWATQFCSNGYDLVLDDLNEAIITPQDLPEVADPLTAPPEVQIDMHAVNATSTNTVNAALNRFFFRWGLSRPTTGDRSAPTI